MTSAIHISGIRVAHVEAPERGVRVNRAEPVEGPIKWEAMQRVVGVQLRMGRGQSGLIYRVRRQDEWRVTVIGSRRQEIEVGSARMQDHAMALAGLWEQAVLNGRIDMS